jgi:TolB-like protein/DNA-binding winged helix-turn-helix (wHTH) protein/Tfp pilus assembly protein PilF
MQSWGLEFPTHLWGSAEVATDPVRVQRPFKFGDGFEFDPAGYELRRAGIPTKLEPTPFGILSLLIEQRGQLVSRQEIVERIWGKGVFLDTDNSINGGIRKIRQALNDDPENPRFIQTVTGRGYRFIAPLVETEPETPAGARLTTVQSAPAEKTIDPVPNLRRKFRSALTLAASLIVIALLALWMVPVFSHRTAATSPIRSIAVLPLDNLSGDSSQDYFADAMTDELITDLAKVGALRVTSRTTVALYRHTHKTLPEIARELNVDGIVEGSVVRSGQRVRITAQLIHASADQHVWAESYERDLGDVLLLQSDVAQAITQQVRAQLTPELKEQFGAARPVNPGAYEAYLKGRYYIYNTSYTDALLLNQAKTNFEVAIRKDPNFSAAYSGLAETYICLVVFGRGQITAADGYRSARNAVQRALELDPNNGEAYDALGGLNWYADLDWNAAERSFNRALALAPSFSCAHENRAMLMAFMGRRDEALAELEKSKQIDPGPDSTGVESAVYLQLRDWEHLQERSRVRLAADPNDRDAHSDLGTAFEGTGKLPQAIAEYQKAIELSNGDAGVVASLGHAYAVMGNRAAAEKILRNIGDKSKSGKASPYLAATIYAGLGQKDKAMELIEEAYDEKSSDVAWALKFDVRTDNLRADPRFQHLLQRAGLQ